MNRNKLNIIRKLPKLTLDNTSGLPRNKKHVPEIKSMVYPKDNYGKRQSIHPIGILGMRIPWYMKWPKSDLYDKPQFQRPLVPISLLKIQRLIDKKRVDVSQPIDLTTLCNTKLFKIDTQWLKHYGFALTDEGDDIFSAKVNLEVQHATEAAIAAVERAGGVITTRYYDLYSIDIKRNPEKFFYSGLPIPKCKLPPKESVAYYSEACHRGYLCDPARLAEDRLRLAQKYGYQLQEELEDNHQELLNVRKDPRQLFHDLEPGWVVNMIDKEVLLPVSEELVENYRR